MRQLCNKQLAKEVPTKDGIVFHLLLIYPTINIKDQLRLLYSQNGFEESCRKWVNRNIKDNYLADIYDGNIWKNFKNQDEDFFTSEHADTHLGLMINLDWFSPFKNSVYSTGAIYAVICNLPRELRFKPQNIITLALLPGPKEVKSHHINHYLAPLVDQLLELWNGVEIPTNESPNGKKNKCAVIYYSCDIPAARKLCGQISARIACFQCEKHAQFDARHQPNFGGFSDMDDWFVERDIEKIKKDAYEWLQCKTEDQRKKHLSETLVRWSELYRLPYFNPIKHVIVDPMHCLFLGIAKWIVMRLWIEGGKLSANDLKLMDKRAKKLQPPSDIGRIPHKIATGEGFSGYTTDQWRTFIMIYATTITWDLLTEPDRHILANFVRACNLLVCRILDKETLNEAHQRLLNVAKLIEHHYGPEKITPNIHLSLHLCENCMDYGPLYSFWCFSFERMNGILGRYRVIVIYSIILCKNTYRYI